MEANGDRKKISRVAVQIILIILTVAAFTVVSRLEGKEFGRTFALVVIGLLLLFGVLVGLAQRKAFRQFRDLSRIEQDERISGLEENERWQVLTALGREREFVPSTIEPETFTFPKEFRTQVNVAFWLMAGVTAVIAAIVLASPPEGPAGWITAGGLAAFFGAYAYYLHTVRRVLRQRIEITDRAITQLFDSGEFTSMEWTEVSRIFDRPLLKRLELHDSQSRRIIKIEHQIGSYYRLRAIVRAKTPAGAWGKS